MKINSSYLFAGAAVIAIALWFMVNAKEAREAPPRAKTTVSVKTSVPTVVYEPREAVEHCLLYTSPSPRDQRGSRMPSSA